MYLYIKKYLLALWLILIASSGFTNHEKISNLTMKDIELGRGLEALPFSVVEVHYTGKLKDGKVFDSSIKRDKPLKFTLGAGQVIQGWETGIRGMKTNGRRILNIPPELAYGKQGIDGVIPPNATLNFEVELISVTPPPFENISNSELQEKLQNGIKLIDIRRTEEWYETGVIDGSIKLTAFDGQGRFIQSFVDKLQGVVQPDEEFIVICRTGNRTAALSNWLVTKGGYKNAINVQEGITSWIKEGRLIKKPNNKPVN